MTTFLFAEVEGRFIDAPSDDLSTGAFRVGYTADESVRTVHARIMLACETYGVAYHLAKITF